MKSRIASRLQYWADRVSLFRGVDPVTRSKIKSRTDLVHIGSDYGGWIVPSSMLHEGSICYCAGVGEDITFDLGLIDRFGVDVWAIDPTPRALAHVQQINPPEAFRVCPFGLWVRDESVHFYEPANPSHVSHSLVNLQNTSCGGFDAPCRRLSSLMREHGHHRIDLLKLDIEGAEYDVISSVLEDSIEIGILCVEFNEFQNRRARSTSIRHVIERLRNSNFTIVSVTLEGEYVFVQSSLA